jgi:hypothetical protein
LTTSFTAARAATAWMAAQTTMCWMAAWATSPIGLARAMAKTRFTSALDTAPGKLSTLQFKAGVAAADVTFKQVYDPNFGGTDQALELSIPGTTDKITISRVFHNDDVV